MKILRLTILQTALLAVAWAGAAAQVAHPRPDSARAHSAHAACADQTRSSYPPAANRAAIAGFLKKYHGCLANRMSQSRI